MSRKKLIFDRLDQIQDMPTLPEIVMKVERMARDSETSVRDLAAVMAHDQAMSIRVLKAANSSAYGARSPITSVEVAISRIGMQEVRNIAMSLSTITVFKGLGHGVDYKKFWRHVLSVAMAAEAALKFIKTGRTGADQESDFFVAGLFHDLGILVMDQYFQQDFQKIIKVVKSKNLALDEVERKLLGTDHGEIGAYFVRKWNLPPHVAEAVCYHHQPDAADESAKFISQVIHLANFACSNQGIDSGITPPPYHMSQGAWYDLGLEVEDIPAIIHEVEAKAAKSEVLLALA
ncbi:MAG: HDOD domain-containing protein [Deltaproteobacteria bacterium]|nr:HDOD domain-containing protein [Deltaproteobacteria bacterium]